MLKIAILAMAAAFGVMLAGCGLTRPAPADVAISEPMAKHADQFSRVQEAASSSFRVSEEAKAADD